MSRNIGIGEVKTKLLDTDHKQWNCGIGLYDPNKVFFKEDPNGKVIVDGKLCSIVRSKSESNLVIIGGKFYKFVQIGDQIWLAENLDLAFAGASYYNGDSTQSYGRMYTGNKIVDLQEALYDTGWHVPTVSEFEELIAIAGGSSYAGGELKSTTSWNTNNGTDSLGYNGKAGGIYVGGSYSYKGSYGVFWTCVPAASNSQNRFVLQDANAGVYINGLADSCRVNVRLLKDTEPLLLDGKVYKTAKIGSRIWTIENLDWIIPGIAYNVTTIPEEPACWNWDNGDVPLKNRGGMYYNAYAAKYINDNNLIPGWHVPYGGEMEEICTLANNKAIKLRNLTGWENVTGGLESNSTNDFRFNAIPAGNRNTSNPPIFVNQDSYALIYTCTIDGTNAYRLNLNRSDNLTYTATTAKNGLSLRLVKDTEPVEIGGRKYKTQKIGNQLWMTENLDYIFEGLTVGGATLQSDIHAWYFNNDPAQSEGLLYNGYAAKYLAEHPELLPEGWRVPESSDFGALQVAVGGANTAGTKLKNPGTMNGINYYGFNGMATGMIRSNGSFTDRNTYLRLWTPNDSQTDETAQQFLTLESDKPQATVVSFTNDKTVAYAIRLVKDLSSDSLSKGGSSVVVEEGKEDEKPIEDEKEVEEKKTEEEVIVNKK